MAIRARSWRFVGGVSGRGGAPLGLGLVVVSVLVACAAERHVVECPSSQASGETVSQREQSGSSESSASGATGRSEQNRPRVAGAFARWQAGGAGFFEEVLAEEVVWTIEGSGLSAGTFRGREEFLARAVRPFVARLAEPVRPTRVELWADGEHVIARWEGRGVARDGLPYQNDYVWIFEMRDSEAVAVTAFLDLAPYDDVLRRSSAAPARGAAPGMPLSRQEAE